MTRYLHFLAIFVALLGVVGLLLFGLSVLAGFLFTPGKMQVPAGFLVCVAAGLAWWDSRKL